MKLEKLVKPRTEVSNLESKLCMEEPENQQSSSSAVQFPLAVLLPVVMFLRQRRA